MTLDCSTVSLAHAKESHSANESNFAGENVHKPQSFRDVVACDSCINNMILLSTGGNNAAV